MSAAVALNLHPGIRSSLYVSSFAECLYLLKDLGIYKFTPQAVGTGSLRFAMGTSLHATLKNLDGLYLHQKIRAKWKGLVDDGGYGASTLP